MQGMELQMVLIVTLGLSVVPSSLATDYFSSISGMDQLLHTEQMLVKDLRAQLHTFKERIKLLERELETIEVEHVLASQDAENYLTNPVNVYRLMRRLHADWTRLETSTQQMVNEMNFTLSGNTKDLSFPSEDDVDGAALALVRLQSTYKLDVSQVAAGILNGIKYGTAMSWQDCFMLGQQLFEMEDYNNTRAWMRESMERLRNRHRQHEIPPEESILNSMELVAKSLFQMGDFDTAYELSQRVLEFDPKRIGHWHLENKVPQASLADGDDRSQRPDDSEGYKFTEEFERYEKVCRGEITASASQLRNLRCRLDRGSHHFRWLAPIKVEEHNLDPYIVTYHDMLSAEKIAELKAMAAPRMRRSTVNPRPGKKRKTASAFRVSKNAWLPYNSHPTMQNMLRHVQYATGLDMTYCEELQVANYGVGGHYEPHWDFFRDPALYPEEEGNRIATAIFYLSDVEQGGATAFPFLNFSVQPQIGNVLFWYNLHSSLDMDYRTKHAGCPVLKGSKWIGNIWIHEATQTFARPCNVFRDNEVSLDYAIIK